MFLVLILLSLTTILYVWYTYTKKKFSYWKTKGIPSLPVTFAIGNALPLFLHQESLPLWTSNIYKYFKTKGLRHGGVYFFNEPTYCPTDPEIIKSILVTDFNNFIDHGIKFPQNRSPLSHNLFFQSGEPWKQVRHRLTPAFSPAKVRHNYPLLINVTESVVKTLDLAAEKSGGEIQLKQISARYTVDMIMNAVFGLECDSFKNPTNEIYDVLNKINETAKLSRLFIKKELQGPGDITKLLFSNAEVEELFEGIAKGIVNLRDEEHIVRDDLTNLILKYRQELGLTMNDIIGNIYVMYLFGHETSATVITFALHSLAYNKDIQEKLREEIFKHLGPDFKKFSYEDVMGLSYLDAIIKGTFLLEWFYPYLCVFYRNFKALPPKHGTVSQL